MEIWLLYFKWTWHSLQFFCLFIEEKGRNTIVFSGGHFQEACLELKTSRKELKCHSTACVAIGMLIHVGWKCSFLLLYCAHLIYSINLMLIFLLLNKFIKLQCSVCITATRAGCLYAVKATVIDYINPHGCDVADDDAHVTELQRLRSWLELWHWVLLFEMCVQYVTTSFLSHTPFHIHNTLSK